MAEAGSATFDTAIGRCGIAWRGSAIVRTALPEPTDEKLRARLAGFPAAPPPPFVQEAITAILRLLAGEAVDLRSIDLDFTGVEAFERRVYDAARAIPVGETRSYGAIAAGLGAPGAAQAVGRALGRNPFPMIIPCHRVLAASGRGGGFSAPGGLTTKLRLLEIERARRDGEALLFEDLPWNLAPAKS